MNEPSIFERDVFSPLTTNVGREDHDRGARREGVFLQESVTAGIARQRRHPGRALHLSDPAPVLDFSTAELADTTRASPRDRRGLLSEATRPNALNLVVIQWLAAGSFDARRPQPAADDSHNHAGDEPDEGCHWTVSGVTGTANVSQRTSRVRSLPRHTPRGCSEKVTLLAEGERRKNLLYFKMVGEEGLEPSKP